MDEKNENISQGERTQETQEWDNINNRQHFEGKSESEIENRIQQKSTEDHNPIGRIQEERGPGEDYRRGVERPSSTTAAIPKSNRLFLILSWISAAFTAFVSPYFAVPGIVLGALANRIAPGSGNAAIITNVVLAVINLLFSLFFVFSLGRIFG